jgi:hypothetical protein
LNHLDRPVAQYVLVAQIPTIQRTLSATIELIEVIILFGLYKTHVVQVYVVLSIGDLGRSLCGGRLVSRLELLRVLEDFGTLEGSKRQCP